MRIRTFGIHHTHTK